MNELNCHLASQCILFYFFLNYHLYLRPPSIGGGAAGVMNDHAATPPRTTVITPGIKYDLFDPVLVRTQSQYATNNATQI